MTLLTTGDTICFVKNWYPFTRGDYATVVDIALNCFRVEARQHGAYLNATLNYADQGCIWTYASQASTDAAAIPLPTGTIGIAGNAGINTSSSTVAPGMSRWGDSIAITPEMFGYKQASEDTYKDLKLCYHEWTEYNSGWTTYEYCKKCDVKRGEEPARETPKDDGYIGDYWITGRSSDVSTSVYHCPRDTGFAISVPRYSTAPYCGLCRKTHGITP